MKLTKGKLKDIIQNEVKEIEKRKELQKIVDMLNNKEVDYIFSNSDQFVYDWFRERMWNKISKWLN